MKECKNKPTIEQLKVIESKKEAERKRIKLAISLDICPCCGSEIIMENVEKYDKPKSYLFGLIKIYEYTWDYRAVCSNKKEHFEDKYNYHSDF